MLCGELWWVESLRAVGGLDGGGCFVELVGFLHVGRSVCANV